MDLNYFSIRKFISNTTFQGLCLPGRTKDIDVHSPDQAKSSFRDQSRIEVCSNFSDFLVSKKLHLVKLLYVNVRLDDFFFLPEILLIT